MVTPAPHHAPEGVRSSLSRPSRLPAIVVSLVIVLGGGFLVWRYLVRDRVVAPPPPAPAATAEQPAAAPDATTEGAAPAPATTQALLESVSKHPLLRKLLAEGDVVRRWSVVAANVALGESPRRELASAAPAGKFSVESAGGRTAIAPASYARYDGFADAVASIDSSALASAWRALHPALQGAYRALGYPYPSIDAAMLRALHRIEQAPVRDGPVFVEPDGNVYAFADEKLESLGQVEKHLLRMGPRNERILQAKAKEVEGALGLAKPRPASEKR